MRNVNVYDSGREEINNKGKPVSYGLILKINFAFPDIEDCKNKVSSIPAIQDPVKVNGYAA
jgi:hypothetical protein